MVIQKVGVLGCGVMGQGIARACAVAGLPTFIFKVTPGNLTAVRSKFEYGLGCDVEKGKLSGVDLTTILHNLMWAEESDDFWQANLQECDLVIESVVEDLDKKRDLFRIINGDVGPNTILASNTSTLSIEALASVTGRADRFLGLHFFNPAHAMKLVEVVKTPKTDVSVLAAAQEFVNKLGKTPVFVNDTSGFVVNRMMMNSLLYAIRCWEDGLGKMEDIDLCMKLGLGHPMGPFALCDLIGLDVVLAIAKELCRGLNDKRFAPPSILLRLVNMGMLGKKTKVGFYNYESGSARPNFAMHTDTTDGM